MVSSGVIDTFSCAPGSCSTTSPQAAAAAAATSRQAKVIHSMLKKCSSTQKSRQLHIDVTATANFQAMACLQRSLSLAGRSCERTFVLEVALIYDGLVAWAGEHLPGSAARLSCMDGTEIM